MNTKYFDKNYLAEVDDDALEHTLWSTFRTLVHNLETRDAVPHLKRKCIEGREDEVEENVAAVALLMVANCEALLSRLDPASVERALEDVARKLAKSPKEELGDALRAFLGIE